MLSTHSMPPLAGTTNSTSELSYSFIWLTSPDQAMQTARSPAASAS